MRAFQILIGIIFAAIVAYTSVVIANHGWNLFPVFFGDIIAMNWPGQFNFDFMGFLVLSGLWVAWRHEFSSGGIVLGVIAFFGGVLFLSLYLLIVSRRANGDAKALLLGDSRAQSSG